MKILGNGAARLSVAPMMDWTDRHDRFLLRQISRRALLYTEMVTTGALLHGDRARLLRFHPDEKPLALQLGGSEPAEMAACAAMAESAGFDEVNINVGCPSDRVRKGRFGACLMAEPGTVAACVAAMRAACALPVTVKCRLGVDDRDSYAFLLEFVDRVAAAGAERLVVHARKAWLTGLSPKQNREVPPLNHDRVHRLKADRPDLTIVLNGGLTSVADCLEHLRDLDGVMIGRAAYRTPMVLAAVDREVFGEPGADPDPFDVVARVLPYIEEEVRAGTPTIAITRHMLGLFAGYPGARAWRRTLSEEARQNGGGADLVSRAAWAVQDTIERADKAEAA